MPMADGYAKLANFISFPPLPLPDQYGPVWAGRPYPRRRAGLLSSFAIPAGMTIRRRKGHGFHRFSRISKEIVEKIRANPCNLWPNSGSATSYEAELNSPALAGDTLKLNLRNRQNNVRLLKVIPTQVVLYKPPACAAHTKDYLLLSVVNFQGGKCGKACSFF
jgi:hypothetical protein